MKISKEIKKELSLIINQKIMVDKLVIKDNPDVSSNSKIKMYKNIFWDEPWNEWFICKNCWNLFNKSFLWNCNCGKWELEEFYKDDELKETFNILSSKDEYRELIAEILDEKIGFIWWWNTSLENLDIEKLKLDNEWLQTLEWNILNIFPQFNINNFYYFAEIWVNKDFRLNNIAWKLYKENLEWLKQRWEEYILVRTTKKTDVPYKWLKNEWYIEVFKYNDIQDRVILVYKI